MPRQIHLGLFNSPSGRHPGGWRRPGSHGRADDIEWVIETARIAESGKFDLFFSADYLGGPEPDSTGIVHGFEPVTELVAIARATSRIGLVASASTSYSEPYNLARLFASLDRISGGRAGWNAVTTQFDAPSRNFGDEKLAPHADRYRRADEFVEVVDALWRSFPADYYVGDAQRGIWSDLSRVRRIEHRGEHFSVEGPINVPASPQGRPVIAQAGSSDDGIALAARFGELVYTAQDSLDEAIAFRGKLDRALLAAGRRPEDLLVMPGILPIVAETDDAAHAIWDELRALGDLGAGLRQLSRRFGFDVTGLDPDGPVPAVPANELGQSRVRLLTALADRNAWNLGDLARYVTAAGGHRVLIGSPSTIADDLERWFVARGADGFNIIPAYMPGALTGFIDLVVPELQRRGLFRTEYEGDTLRENLGLPGADRELTAEAAR